MTEVGSRANSRAVSGLVVFWRRAAALLRRDVSDLLDFAALSLLPSSWWRVGAERLRSGVHPARVLDELIADGDCAGGRDAGALRVRAREALTRASAAPLTPITWSNPAYPSALATIVDPPFILWTRGVVAAIHARAVAIVGSRAGSPYALSVAERLACDLALRGVVVVSGLARGVDSAAHRGALAGGGATVAVLGSGADIIYPAEHRGLAREIERDGLLVSELVPGTPPQPQFFPLRNRIISGLARAVVVIEAGEKSGSLITARAALEQGREVLAVPGSVLTGRNRGAHALLRDGAKIVESADDILEELGWPQAVQISNKPSFPADSGGTGSATDPVLACLAPGEPADLDQVAERSGLSPSRLLPRLLELELSGCVTRLGGGRFVRT